MTANVRVRFAPSPTGFVHVGSLRTALYNYLFAKQNIGTFVLRIEDTDRSRLVEGAVNSLLKTLQTMGLTWDESPLVQSERFDIYQKYATELLAKKQAYYCFCSEERLEKMRQTQQLNKQPTMYDGLCRHLSSEEIEKKLTAGDSHVLRLAIPLEGKTQFTDLIRGEVKFENKLIDDQILVKSDGFPTYHLANVVDDHLMNISHVIRGEEWLSSTPKHIILYQAFGWTAPQFAHIPLLLNADKSKLSKRQGDVAVEDYLKKGILPEALLNFVALLGWNPGTDQEFFSLNELTKAFDITKVQKAGAVFDLTKLEWMNGEYIKKMPLDQLVEASLPYLAKITQNDKKKKMLEKIIKLEQARLKKLSDLPQLVNFFFKLPACPKEMLIWKKGDASTTINRLQILADFYRVWTDKWSKEKLENATMDLIKEKNLDNGTTLWPLRVALSGQEKSPGPFEILEILGQTETLKRIRKAINSLNI